MADRIVNRTRSPLACFVATVAMAITTVAASAALVACDRDGRAAQGTTAPSSSVTASGARDGERRKTETITLRDERFTLEIAADPASIQKGLSGRASIPDDGGMLFVFPDSQMRHFWMIDCLVDIDIIYVDSVGGVTAVHRMEADPQRPGESREAYENRLRRYSSVSRAQFAIELKAGSLDRLGIRPGDRLSDIDWRRIRRHAR